MSEPVLGVGQALAQRELAQPRVQQGLERVGQRATEQFDGAGVDELTQQWAGTVGPQRGEFVEGALGRFELMNAELAHGFWGANAVPEATVVASRRAAASWPASGASRSGSTGRPAGR